MCRLILTAASAGPIAPSCNTSPTTITTTKATTTTTAAPVDEFCKGKCNGDYANPKNPSTFYSCSNGLTYLMNCPSGLVFNQGFDRCDWPTPPSPTGCNSTPKTTITTTPTPTTPSTTVDEFCKGKCNGDYANPKNAYTFYTCSNGLSYLRDCPSGLVFNQGSDRCDWPPTPTPTAAPPPASAERRTDRRETREEHEPGLSGFGGETLAELWPGRLCCGEVKLWMIWNFSRMKSHFTGIYGDER
ncbi:hypothetical protein Q5P01_009420 [Channa striata]|uniref:chitinase n=1 Tax=Channa striata TaxID=64152 RepID=A0AA88SSK0_CHASR|nr:hypothetical protein Q5P01_009420 [Channa striata]